MTTRVQTSHAAALRAWVVTVVPLAGARATAPHLADAAGVRLGQIDKALRALHADGVLTSRMQEPHEATFGRRRSRVYALAVEPS